MKIAIAQIKPVPGDLPTNRDMHMQWIRKAAEIGSDIVFFPELSISGYEPSLVSELWMSTQDEFWKPIQSLCDDLGVAAGLGAPLRTEAGITIGMLVFLAVAYSSAYKIVGIVYPNFNIVFIQKPGNSGNGEFCLFDSIFFMDSWAT